MKHFLLSIFAVLLFSGCRHEINPEDISKMNGYWEIEKVVLPDGKTKDYKINDPSGSELAQQTIDYFKLDNTSGIRKKVMPQLDGKYIDSGTSEKIDVVFTSNKAWLFYNSGYAHWKEEIISISENELVFKNSNNLEYHYKKPVPFSVK